MWQSAPGLVMVAPLFHWETSFKKNTTLSLPLENTEGKKSTYSYVLKYRQNLVTLLHNEVMLFCSSHPSGKIETWFRPFLNLSLYLLTPGKWIKAGERCRVNRYWIRDHGDRYMLWTHAGERGLARRTKNTSTWPCRHHPPLWDSGHAHSHGGVSPGTTVDVIVVIVVTVVFILNTNTS